MEIQLRGGAVAHVDDDVLPLLGDRQWRLHRTRSGGPSGVVSGSAAKRTLVLLHRLIMAPEAKQVVDHIDGDVLNNRRSNLRICSQSDNLKNRRRAKSNKSGYKGVYPCRSAFRAEIKADGVKHRLGRFPTAEEAHQAYSAAAVKLHGRFARLE